MSWPSHSKLVRWSVSSFAAAVGILHLFASQEHHHLEHHHIMAFFIALGVAQLVWASLVLTTSHPKVIRLGIIGNGLVAAIWVLSRTTGIPFIVGADHVEPVGAPDLAATLLEVAIVAVLLHGTSRELARRVRLLPRELGAAAMATGLVVVATTGVLGTPVAGRSQSHSHATDEVGHALAGEHEHASTGTVHTHTGEKTDTHALAHSTQAGSVHETQEGVHGAAAHAQAVGASASPSANLRGTLARVRYGPFTIGSSETTEDVHNPAVTNIIRTRLQAPCTDCYLTAMEPDLVYENGSSANFDSGVMLHHAVLGDSSEPDTTCDRSSTIGWMGRRFFASGNERTKGIIPAPFGYRVDADDWWTGIFEIMNFSDEPQMVWFEFTVHYVPASEPGVKALTPIWLDINNCGTSEYSIPQGRSRTSWEWTSSITGRVVLAAGHVHNWGRSITLSNGTSGARMCKSVAGYGTRPTYQGNIESMTGCAWDRIGVVREGESLQIEAIYDSPAARDDVMGIMMAFVYETSDLSAGSPAPESMTNPPDGSGAEQPSHEH